MSKVIVIGSGPAGISTALYTARAGIETTIIAYGIGSLEKAHEIQNYYGVPGTISGKELALAGIENAKLVGAKIINEEVVSISYTGDFVVATTRETYNADYVVIATGAPRNVPGIKNLKEYEGRGVSYCAICDAFFFRKKSVAVLGNGEFAVHEIKDLMPVVNDITLLTNGDEVTATIPEGVCVDTRKIKALQGEDILSSIEFEDGSCMPVNGLFVAYGTAGSTALARKIGAEINGNKIVVDENMQTSVPGLYAAGDCIGGLLQVSKAVADGAIAGNHISKNTLKNT